MPANSVNKVNKIKFLKTALIAVAAVAVLVTAAVLIGMILLQAPNPADNQLKRFVVQKGEPVSAISEKLEQENLIKSSLVFKIYYKLKQTKTQIQAGSFELSPAMDAPTILEILSEGSDDLWITLPEGLRREEIDQSLAEYPLLDYDTEEFLAQTVSLEGQLFPDTYLVPKEITTQALINLMHNTFEKKIEPLQSQIEQSDHSFNEILTMASLLEREAQDVEQLELISGVLWKRLERGMPLQVDATLQYAAGYNEETGSWWSAPSAADKEIDSKFNTYQNPGLPPRPICNPSLNAFTAALNPQLSSYLFYLHDRQGRIHFGETLQDHNQNINQYLR